jgi:hypothetical protein
MDLGIEFNYNYHRMVIISTLSLITFINVMIVVQIYHGCILNGLIVYFNNTAFSYFFSLMTHSILMLNFIFATISVRQRFQKLNKFMIK